MRKMGGLRIGGRRKDSVGRTAPSSPPSNANASSALDDSRATSPMIQSIASSGSGGGGANSDAENKHNRGSSKGLMSEKARSRASAGKGQSAGSCSSPGSSPTQHSSSGPRASAKDILRSISKKKGRKGRNRGGGHRPHSSRTLRQPPPVLNHLRRSSSRSIRPPHPAISTFSLPTLTILPILPLSRAPERSNQARAVPEAPALRCHRTSPSPNQESRPVLIMAPPTQLPTLGKRPRSTS